MADQRGEGQVSEENGGMEQQQNNISNIWRGLKTISGFSFHFGGKFNQTRRGHTAFLHHPVHNTYNTSGEKSAQEDQDKEG